MLIKELHEQTKTGIVTVPKIYYYPYQSNRIWYAGGEFVKHRTDTVQNGYNEIDTGQYNSHRYVGFCCGCCFMIKSSDLKRVGLLREEYFLYCEDTELCIRASLNGISIKYIPQAKLWHKVSASTGAVIPLLVHII